jgi:hypothetical protein
MIGSAPPIGTACSAVRERLIAAWPLALPR